MLIRQFWLEYCIVLDILGSLKIWRRLEEISKTDKIEFFEDFVDGVDGVCSRQETGSSTSLKRQAWK